MKFQLDEVGVDRLRSKGERDESVDSRGLG